jgi:hypothetical protein
MRVIDRQARDKAAELLRQFMAGTITNFHLEESWPSSKDPVLRELEDTLWCFYDDFEEHKMRGRWKLPKQSRTTAARWVLFLHSDCEYKWPLFRYAGIRPLYSGWFARLTGLARRREKLEAEFMAAGEYEYWPFINRESFERSNANPKLLARA